MGDSVEVLESGYRRSVGAQKPGRLHKGHGTVAANSSIPSKYQTLVTSNADKRGFGGTSKRFNHDATVNENPGPGSYRKLPVAERQSTSFSKKGMGVGFVSKTRRVPRNKGTAGPGPAYALPSMLSTRKDYNSAAVSSSFHSPIAVQREKGSLAPAPNSYNVSDDLTHKNNGSQFQASFKSTSRRVDFYRNTSSAPAPGHYNVNDTLVKSSVRGTNSSFKSTTERQMCRSPAAVPGPGHYKPYETPTQQPNKMQMPRKHYLCISAPAMPLPPPLPEPGPGSYELVDYKGPAKHYMSSAAFVSSTSRWTGGEALTAPKPGPATYRPDNPGAKQSFLYNATRKWVH